MEVELQRHERIMAPLQLVWEEMESLDQILAKTPQISDFEIVPGGRTARGKARLAWGPVKWAIDVEFTIVEFVPRQRMAYCVEGPSLEVHLAAAVNLAAVGENETRLDYVGNLDVQHRRAGRMRGLFNEIAEDHVHSLVHRIKVKAEQRRLAQERLLK